MARKDHTQVIIGKLSNGVKFGLYDGGRSCFFDDGTYVSYNELWNALRILNNLEIGHKKTLFELCPGTYKGVFSYRFSRIRLLNKIRNYIFPPVQSLQA